MPAMVNFVWEPDPMVYAESMNRVADSFYNRVPPLAAASEIVQSDIRERFETETDPQGNHWQPWSETYAPYARTINKGILHQSGALEEAATSSEAIEVTNDSVFYRTALLPHYGLAHESGLPDRTPPLPERSFLGVSDQARGVIMGQFVEWFEGNINLFVTARGRVGRRHAIRGTVPGLRGRPFISRASAGLQPLT